MFTYTAHRNGRELDEQQPGIYRTADEAQEAACDEYGREPATRWDVHEAAPAPVTLTVRLYTNDERWRIVDEHGQDTEDSAASPEQLAEQIGRAVANAYTYHMARGRVPTVTVRLEQ